MRYRSDKNICKEVYKDTFKRHPQFFIGLLALLACLGILGYVIYDMVDWIRFGEPPKSFLISRSIIIAVLLLAAYPIISFMISGGKTELLRREDETLDFFKDHIRISYTPEKSIRKKFGRIEKSIYYCDIESLEYEGKKRRLKITSGYQETDIRNPEEEKSVENTEISDKETTEIYLYEKYQGFDKIVEQIGRSARKIVEYDSNLR